MKVIIDELEKVFGAEFKEDDNKNPSGRSSYGSSERSSQGSSITFCENSSNGNESTMCSLQEYLLEPSVVYLDTTNEQRTSLAELFQRTKGPKGSTKSWFENKGTHNDAVWFSGNIVRKMLGRNQASRNYREASKETADSDLAGTKVQKMLKKFQSKLYPETSETKDISKAEKEKKKTKKNKISYSRALYNNDLMIPCHEITAYPQSGVPKEAKQHYNTNSDDPISLISDAYANKGFWIKTDTDYHILEL